MLSIREGMTVYAADGHKLGKVAICEADGFVVEKGTYFPRDRFARYADVREIRGEDVHLAVERDALLPVEDRAKLEERGEWAARGAVPGADAVGAPVDEPTIRNPALEDEEVERPPRHAGASDGEHRSGR
jgi:hypothetical protein